MSTAAALLDNGPGDDPLSETPGLAAFVRDDMTRAALAAKLGSSWNAVVSAGGIEEAIEQFWTEPTPRYLVVDLSETGDPLAALDRLAEVCAPGTVVLAIGDTNDITFYRTLREAGVADYLVKPVNPDMLAAALQNLKNVTAAKPRDAAEEGAGSIIAVAGARGGVGVTTLATTLGWFLAKNDELNTIIVDLDLKGGTAALALDVEPGRGLAEALERPNRIDSLFVSTAATAVSDNLTILCTEEALDTDTAPQPGSIRKLAGELRRMAQRVLFDIPRGRTDLLREAFGEAATVIIVTDLSLAGLRDATRLLALARNTMGQGKAMVVANRVGRAKKGELSRADFEKALGVPLTAVIPEDVVAVSHALNSGQPLPVGAPGSKTTLAMRLLAESFRDDAPARRGILAKLLRGGKSAAR